MKTPLALFVLLLTLLAAAFPAFTSARTYPTQAVLEQQNLDRLLAEAVKNNDVKSAKSLLKQGAYANTLLSEHRAGGSVLHAAAADGNVEMVRVLLDHGAEPILRNTHFETALDLAVKGNFTTIAELLRQAEEGTYQKPMPPVAPEIPVSPTVAPVTPSAPRTITAVVKPPTTSKKMSAKSIKKQPQKKVAAQTKPKANSSGSAAQRQAKALKKLNDYNYVKHFSPISGPTYRSTKW